MRWIHGCVLALLISHITWGQFPQLSHGAPDSAVHPGANAIGSCRVCNCQQCCCPREVCVPTIEKVTEKESCWTVTGEKVCIPAVRLPWQSGGSPLTLFSWLRHPCCTTCKCANCEACCPPVCGQVRCVNVLDSKEYEVTKCECKWEIRRLPPCDCTIVR
jgi:hypothetical protein